MVLSDFPYIDDSSIPIRQRLKRLLHELNDAGIVAFNSDIKVLIDSLPSPPASINTATMPWDQKGELSSWIATNVGQMYYVYLDESFYFHFNSDAVHAKMLFGDHLT